MEPPNMNPLLHWGNYGIIGGFHFLDPLGGLGIGYWGPSRFAVNRVCGVQGFWMHASGDYVKLRAWRIAATHEAKPRAF